MSGKSCATSARSHVRASWTMYRTWKKPIKPKQYFYLYHGLALHHGRQGLLYSIFTLFAVTPSRDLLNIRMSESVISMTSSTPWLLLADWDFYIYKNTKHPRYRRKCLIEDNNNTAMQGKMKARETQMTIRSTSKKIIIIKKKASHHIRLHPWV